MPENLAPPQRVINLPDDVRIRGANVVCSGYPQGRQWNELAPNVWAAMWKAWEWDDWIAPQISDCASLGNAARLWGDTTVVTSGLITRDVYLARWQQMLEYAEANGLYVFPCGGGRGTFSHEEAVAVYQPWSELLASYPNVLGVDVLNEAWGNTVSLGYEYNENVALVRLLTDTVRSAGLPATASFPMAKSEWWNWDSWLYRAHPSAPYWDACDYIDIHVYATTTPAQLDATSNMPWAKGKPIVFGEFGASITEASNTEITAVYKMVETLVSGRTDTLGALAWSTYDVDTTNNAFGLFVAPGEPRVQLTSALGQFPIIR